MEWTYLPNKKIDKLVDEHPCPRFCRLYYVNKETGIERVVEWGVIPDSDRFSYRSHLFFGPVRFFAFKFENIGKHVVERFHDLPVVLEIHSDLKKVNESYFKKLCELREEPEIMSVVSAVPLTNCFNKNNKPRIC